MVYGIDQEKINCEMLFNLLCQYGNVLRIRFMATKRDTVMAELGTPGAVGNAMKFLQGITLFGLTLQLKPSIQSSVRDVHEPFDLPDKSPSFRDYSMSALQRFSTPDSAARNRLIYPTKLLHWYNAPVNMDEAKIRQLFSERNAPEPKSVTVFVGRSERSSSGLVEMENIEQANEALALVNHTPVVSPLGKTPYIVKLAYATPSRRHGDSDEAGGGEGGAGRRHEAAEADSGAVDAVREMVTEAVEDHIEDRTKRRRTPRGNDDTDDSIRHCLLMATSTA